MDDMAVFRQLVEVQRADVNADLIIGVGFVILHAASIEGNTEFVSYLLSVPGIDVNLRESTYGSTALLFASANGIFFAVVSDLLQHPAVDVNMKNNQGDFALYLACHDDPDVAMELLGHPGIDVNQTLDTESVSGTCLQFACAMGNTRAVKELLKKPEIRVNEREVWSDGREGESALGYCLAARKKSDRLAILKELLKHPGLDRGDMKKALQIAQGRRLRRCAQAIADALSY